MMPAWGGSTPARRTPGAFCSAACFKLVCACVLQAKGMDARLFPCTVAGYSMCDFAVFLVQHGAFPNCTISVVKKILMPTVAMQTFLLACPLVRLCGLSFLHASLDRSNGAVTGCRGTRISGARAGHIRRYRCQHPGRPHFKTAARLRALDTPRYDMV